MLWQRYISTFTLRCHHGCSGSFQSCHVLPVITCLVVEPTNLNNMIDCSQIGNLPQVGVKNNTYLNPPPSNKRNESTVSTNHLGCQNAPPRMSVASDGYGGRSPIYKCSTTAHPLAGSLPKKDCLPTI